MALTDREIQQLVEKLRGKYAEYAKKYSRKWFDVNPFEDRLIMAAKNRMNLEGFILAEISNFENPRTLRKRKRKENSFSRGRPHHRGAERPQKIHAEAVSSAGRLRDRPFLRRGERHGLVLFPVLWIIITDPILKNVLVRIENDLGYLAVPRGKAPSKRIEDHSMILSAPEQRPRHRPRQNNYLKETAFVLHKIVDFAGMLERRENDWALPLPLNKLFVEDARKKTILALFSGHTGYGAIMKVRDQCSQIIEDFRLKAFKKRDGDERI